jgi:hypothetical protein
MTTVDWWTVVIANKVVAFKIISHLKLFNFSCVYVGDPHSMLDVLDVIDLRRGPHKRYV